MRSRDAHWDVLNWMKCLSATMGLQARLPGLTLCLVALLGVVSSEALKIEVAPTQTQQTQHPSPVGNSSTMAPVPHGMNTTSHNANGTSAAAAQTYLPSNRYGSATRKFSDVISLTDHLQVPGNYNERNPSSWTAEVNTTDPRLANSKVEGSPLSRKYSLRVLVPEGLTPYGAIAYQVHVLRARHYKLEHEIAVLQTHRHQHYALHSLAWSEQQRLYKSYTKLADVMLDMDISKPTDAMTFIGKEMVKTQAKIFSQDASWKTRNGVTADRLARLVWNMQRVDQRIDELLERLLDFPTTFV